MALGILLGGLTMKLYLAAFNAGRGWQPMRRKVTKVKSRLCVFDNYDSAMESIKTIKYRYPEETQFKIVTFVED